MKPTYEPIENKPKPIKITPNYNRSYPFFLVGLVIVTFGLMVGTVIKLVFTVSQPLNSEINSKASTSEVGSLVKINSDTNSDRSASDVVDVISLAKFNQIQNGMTIQQVQELIGNSGKLVTTSNDDKLYQWQNPQGSNAIVEFKRDQVISKSQAGLK
ncbi:Beta-lactamase inhibitor (BLIP) [Synechococcus sp. PCC 7502]|uniref:beta-lactamase inhibitor (BLIP) n=1 Tax=Synechococcus sp. PCC 7502 TaxID=1173263 RepID=UPI00029FE139|nr:beta-lactamase inhibitor (BLIP) [Synechococcus sp. PCC 7502]AFY74274.1 Beta-lactamase inhibitor (BLIP) [Synechococcus sp. PCC 7502]